MTKNFDVFAKRKGQSAIEYLMTYGWMLLVVAIVGGAIFATVQGQCTASTSGFSTSDVRIADFGLTNTGLGFEVRNAAADPISVTNVSITDGSKTAFTNSNVDIPVGSSKTTTADQGAGFSNVDGCNDFDVQITYDVQGGIQNQSVTGSLTDSMSLT
ncbi:MAG: hypothetical protein ABEJ87_06045 [Candidatus Nanohalobium sp.]